MFKKLALFTLALSALTGSVAMANEIQAGVINGNKFIAEALAATYSNLQRPCCVGESVLNSPGHSALVAAGFFITQLKLTPVTSPSTGAQSSLDVTVTYGSPLSDYAPVKYVGDCAFK